MKEAGILFFSIILLTGLTQAQETRFFMPREIVQAYENGTRSYDGRPGPKYWDNTVDYQIEVEVLPSEKILKGSESVTYYNNSPDALTSLVIRLYHDAFRKANPRDSRVRPSDITDEGVKLERLVIDGQTYRLSNNRLVRRRGTNMTIQLQKQLEPGQKLEMQIDWSQHIPETTIRTGAYTDQDFFLAYWYPQVAVYDDVFGWDNLNYGFSAEFYNNLANYDVRIKAPKNYTVLATGVLQNASEVLSSEMEARYQQAKKSEETITIISPDDLEGDFGHQSDTWHYQAQEVSDFSFCLSDRFCWDAANQVVDGRNVLISSFYPADAVDQCKDVTANQQKMMKHFSEDVPGIPYPYPEFTTFIRSGRGGGGMETPMMANNGGPGLGVTIHEMFHTYFPMYVRTNERRFAWMDEGWANFNTALIRSRYFENDNSLLFASAARSVNRVLGTISDLPLISSTQFTDNTNYGYTAYSLPQFIYATLHHHLGDKLFLRCYREYIRRWAKKAPTPYDFFYTFENVSGQDLAWLWKPWFFEFGQADVAIQSYKKGKLILENKGSRPVPITVQLSYNDGKKGELSVSAAVWKDSQTHRLKIPRYKDVNALSVNMDIPDINPLNNFSPSLQQQYTQFAIADDIEGSYTVPDYRTQALVSRKDGILQLTLQGYNRTYYLVPSANNEFKSIGNGTVFTFSMDEGKCKEVKFRIYNNEVVGVKE